MSYLASIHQKLTYRIYVSTTQHIITHNKLPRSLMNTSVKWQLNLIIISHHQRSASDFMQGNYPNSMSIPPFSPQEITNIIKNLKNKKSNVKEIPISLLKRNCTLIANPITLLFNQSHYSYL